MMASRMLTDSGTSSESLQRNLESSENYDASQCNKTQWEGQQNRVDVLHPLEFKSTSGDEKCDTMLSSSEEEVVDDIFAAYSDDDIADTIDPIALDIDSSDSNDSMSESNDSMSETEEFDTAIDENLMQRLRSCYMRFCIGASIRPRREHIIQDSSASFFLIDGDSLLLEAAQTKTWRYGQQLHLFYIIELYILRLNQHIGRCEVVFFDEMEKMWSKDVFMKISRSALIKHLTNNCKLIVHYKWRSIFCPKWTSYLRKEQPSFFLIHNGYKTGMAKELIFCLIAHYSLSMSLDVAYTRGVRVLSSKLYALYVKADRSFVQNLMKTINVLKRAWVDVMKSFPTISLPILKAPQSTENRDAIDTVFYESVHIYWDKLTPQEQVSDDEKHYISKWAHYFAIMSVLTISERVSIISPSWNEKPSWNPRLNRFTESIYQNLHNTLALNHISGDYLADLLDLSLINHLFYSNIAVSDICFKEKVIDKYYQLLSLFESSDTTLDISVLPLNMIDNICSRRNTDRVKENYEYSLATVTSRLSDEYAGDVRKKLNVVEDFSKFQKACKGYAFDESYHWHSGKPLGDDIDRKQKEPLSKNPWVRKKQLENNQKYMNSMTLYGESLATGIKPVVIVSSAQSGKSKKKSEKKMGKSALSIIEKNKERMKEKELKDASCKWKFLLNEIDKVEDLKTAVKLVIDFISKLDRGLVFEEPLLHLLKLQFRIWQKSCEDGNKSYTDAAELIHSMHKIIREECYIVSDKLKELVANYFIRIGYKDVAAIFNKEIQDEKMSEQDFIGIPYNIFQMKYMGHLMKRNERSDPDPRVTGFIPDTWQRELLDVIDNYESALVVAPTSSGKTFCSYYCMEKVLREFNDGIVVYVSPTKALVNQVHASIYARFRKNLPDGQTIVGVFTRDYQHDAMNCQILVTVPQCLEILLLSPKRQAWASKLRYVILDEVHCIGGEIGGEVWEHLITLIRCPFLALSATIGNPVEFHRWLAAVQDFKYKQGTSSTLKGKKIVSMMRSQKVALIIYSERYSDVETSIYIPRNKGHDDLVVTHPCMFLDSRTLRNKGFPSGMSLSPKETYELWLAGIYTLEDGNKEAKEGLEAWCPTKHFGSKLFISRVEARQYEISLKEYLFDLIRVCDGRATKLIGYFRNQLPVENVKLDEKYVGIPGISHLEFDIFRSFPLLIKKLEDADKLPVLVFLCDRHEIKKLAHQLRNYVRREIKKRMDGMGTIVQRTEKLEEFLDVRAKAARDINSTSPSDDGKRDLGTSVELDGKDFRLNRTSPSDDGRRERGPAVELDGKDSALYEELLRNKMKIDKVRIDCSFVSPGVVSEEYVDKVLEKVFNRKEIELLQLGISYHHAGCSTKFRKATEILFRCKYVQVVTATTTLALGIHMPCKTVVIVGDDPYVDALTYRQMIGRSGRRGFDNIGNVVFYGAPVRKISTLIKADLQSLEGLYPISCTLILRIFLLVANSKDEDGAHKKAMVVLSHPFFTHLKPMFQRQLQHFFLFATDHLIRQMLLDDKGVPLQFAGLVSHLHYLEPGNMIFVYLLRQGLFHDVCKSTVVCESHYGYTCRLCNISPIIGKMFRREDSSLYLCRKCYNRNGEGKVAGRQYIGGKFACVNPKLKYTYSETTLRLLVCILCHIFCEVEIPEIRLVDDRRNPGSFKLKEPPFYGSKVLLDSLPPSFHTAIKRYNKDVRINVNNYLLVVSQSLKKEDIVTLPLSGKHWTFSNEKCFYDKEQDDGAVISFSQLSGCNNETIKRYCLDDEEIFKILPAEIFTDFKSFPAISLAPKNAYALDFFKHGNLVAIGHDNHLKEGEVFQMLKDFMLMIMSIATALEELGPEESDDHVIWAFKHLSFEYRERFQTSFPDAKVKF